MAMQASQFIGSKISLVTKAEIRYEGILYALDLQEATISLAKVKSFGTEDRPSDQPVHPKDEVFEFIIFRGADIKSLDVVEPPKSVAAMTSGQPPNDPAIVEVSYYHSGSKSGGGHSAAGKSKRSGNNAGVLNNLLAGQSPTKGGRRRRRSGAGAGVDAGAQAGQQRRRNNRNRNSGNQSDDSQNGGPSNNGTGNNGGQKQQNGRGRSRGRQMRSNSGDAGFFGQMQQGPPRGYYQPPPFMMHPPGGFRGGFRGGRGRNFFGRRNQHQPQGIIQAQQPAKVTFEEPFDFEKSHEELVQTLAKLEIVDKEKAAAAEAAAIQNGEASPPRDERENKEPAAEVVYYNKDDFFDNISCDGLKKQKPGRNVRIDRRAEHKLNSETFGESAARGGQRRGGYGGSYFYRNNYYRGNPNPYYSMMGGYDPTSYFMPGNGGYGNYRRGGGGGGGRGRGFYSGGFYDNF